MQVTELKSVSVGGQPVRVFELTNGAGMSVRLMEYGATVLSVSMPDRRGDIGVVTLGFSDPADSIRNTVYLGAVCGRVANRVSRGRFEQDGQTWQLDQNHGIHHLHGGVQGFDRKTWCADVLDETPGRVAVRFRLVSEAGDGGYPGCLHVDLVYSLTESSELLLDYEARVEAGSTVVNLTNHTYWNLGSSDTILDHELQLNADRLLVVDEVLIPTGEFQAVSGTSFDFNHPRRIAQGMPVDSNGYDHCYVIEPNLQIHTREAAPELTEVARLHDRTSGRTLALSTDQPGVQLYTGGFLDGSPASGGFPRFGGVCLECQQLPDAPNRPEFPSIRLDVGQVYRQRTTCRLFVSEDPFSD